jgi:hypothetical protein
MMPHLSGSTLHRCGLLMLCACLTATGCREEDKEKIKHGIDKARDKAAHVTQNVKQLKQDASQIPDNLIADARARDLMGLSDEEFAQQLQAHLIEIKRYDAALSRIMLLVKARPDLFPKGEKAKQFKSMKPKQRKELRELYAGTLDYMRALDGIKQYWSGFHRINVVTHKDRHAAAFLLGYAAWMVQYRHGLTFVDQSMPNKGLEKFLDEPSSRYDITDHSFKQLKWHIINVKAVSRFLGSRHYYKLQKETLLEGPCKDEDACLWAVERMDDYHDAAKAQLSTRAAIQFSYNSYDIVRDAAFSSWFPVQKGVAEWLGDTKIKRLHAHLITDEQLVEMQKVMQPADIIVARKNWYLSNIGLPGFWPHAELFLGHPDELDAYFADANLPETMPALKGATLSEHLKKTYPEAWLSYTSKPDHHGDSHQIIEAVSEGVVFSSLERGAGADYVGVMRPRRDKIAKAKAILRAFAYWGRPYDFDFDFMTDSTIVCTELVFKAWERDETYKGLNLELIDVMGRDTLPANEIVRQFALDARLGDDERQLDFVYFLDGRERSEGAIIGSMEDFVASCERPKWDTAQE